MSGGGAHDDASLGADPRSGGGLDREGLAERGVRWQGRGDGARPNRTVGYVGYLRMGDMPMRGGCRMISCPFMSIQNDRGVHGRRRSNQSYACIIILGSLCSACCGGLRLHAVHIESNAMTLPSFAVGPFPEPGVARCRDRALRQYSPDEARWPGPAVQ